MVAKRRCDYKGCYEYRDRTNLNPDIKFFSFPSDPERTKKWLKLSQTTTENPKYICSKHFEDKFISRVQRRVHLVVSAVPIDYNTIISQRNDGTNKFQMEEPDKINDYEVQIISDTIQNDIIMNETTHEKTLDVKNLGLKSHKQKNILLNSIPIKVYPERGRLLESMEVYNDAKIIQKRKYKFIKLANGNVVKLNKTNDEDKFELIPTEEEIETCHLNINVSNECETKKKKTSEACSKVRTIVIQDEEYIQMPKSLYMEERIELLNKIECYKSVLKDFKEKLNDIDFS